MKKFLVCIDFSSVSDDVLESAIDFARAFKSELTLLHVIASDETPESAQVLAREKIDVCAAQLRHAGVACASHLLIGPPSKVILEEAVRVGADFIVLGSHGQGQLYSMLVGSVAGDVLKKAACGVILLPPEGKAYA